jgi:thiamine pyrophosphate-dependent acetolactate synthase large subunit-like protein
VNRTDAVRELIAGLPQPDAVVAGVGATSGALWTVTPAARNLYNMDFAYPTPVGLGLALARPDLSVLVLEGDGSALAGASGYCTLAEHRPVNLTVVVFENGVYGTGDGSFATPAAARIDALAIAAGIPAGAVHRLSTREAVVKCVASAEPGFRLLVVEVDRSDSRSGGRARIDLDFTENGIRFQRHLTEIPGQR